MNNTIPNLQPTEEEMQEYLADKSERDFYENLETGLENLGKWKFISDGRVF